MSDPGNESPDPAGAFTREDADFESHGERCAAWLYRPAGAGRPPVLVMAHGFAAERSFRLPAFAERFARLGVAVLLFDYRCFGDSTGTPRQWVSPRRHNEDWDAAIDAARRLEGVDRERVALWGTSFAGGHVLCTAARRRDVRALIAQVPFVDGRAPPGPLAAGRTLRLLAAGLRDTLRRVAGLPAYTLPVIGQPGDFAILTTPDAEAGYRAVVPPDSTWQNRVPARVLLSLPRYRPVSTAHEIACPALLVLAEQDSLIPAEAVERTAARIPDCRLARLPCQHFEPYVGEWFERNVALQEAFLREHLL